MQVNLTKTINELAPLTIQDLIEVELPEVKAIAAASNGSFLTDRGTLSAADFLAKYFAGYEIYDTIEKIEARRKAEIFKDVKAKRVKAARPAILDQYGNYIVALWESGGEFSASYRKTTHIQAHWHVLTKHEIEYKVDGRHFSVVHHTSSRKDAIELKNKLIVDMESRGLSYKGELPV